MGIEDNPYRDEEGEPLIDYDDMMNEKSPDAHADDQYNDNFEEEEGDDDNLDEERPLTPVYDSDKVGKLRKRLIKQSDFDMEGGKAGIVNLVDEDEDDFQGKSEASLGKEVRELEGRRKAQAHGEKHGSSSRAKPSSAKSKSKPGRLTKNDEGEIQEMWQTIAGDDSEDDRNGVRTVDDDNFIDDSGIDPAMRYASDDEPHSPSAVPQAEEIEEDEEIKELFKIGKKRKKTEKSPGEISMLVENIMAELEITAEDDALLNKEGKPAINKLKKLPLLTEILSKKQLQQEFIDHGVLSLLKNWLEPLPDGSLPNINVRAAILKILNDLPLDLEQHDRREQLKRSGLGRVIMFLSKSEEEITANRKLAKELVDKWSRPIFNKSTRFEDMRNFDEERAYRQPLPKKRSGTLGFESRDGDLDFDIPRDKKPAQSSSRMHATRPEAVALDFVVRPQSKVDPDLVRARAKQVVQDQRRLKMNKKLQQLKAPKKKALQAAKVSVEGRGMIKYL